MARVKGRDLLLDMLDAVHALEATSAQHTEQIEEHARLLTKFSADAMQLRRDVAQLQTHVAQLQTHVAQLQTDVTQLYGSVRVLSDDSVTMMESGNKMAELTRVTTQQVGRLAKAVAALAGDSDDRMTQIESRLDRLERKAG